MAQKKIIWPFFFIALFFTTTNHWSLIPFAPFLAMVFYHHSKINTLWIAATCGLIMDLLSASPFGIYALNYAVVSFLLFRYRIYFIEKPIGFAFFTSIFSLLSTMFTRFFFILYEISLPFTWRGLITDFFIMPLIDGIYAFICFSIPLIIYRLMRKHWFLFLFFRKETKKKKEKELNAYVK